MSTSRRMSELLAVCVTLVLLLVMGGVAAAPLLQASRVTDKTEANRKLLRQLIARTTTEASLRRDNEDLVASGQSASLLLEGETTGIAGANLQKLLNDIVLENRGEATSFQILRATEDSELVHIGLNLVINTNIDGLRAIVHTIETGTPLIFIENMEIKGAQSEFVAPEPEFIGPIEVTLQVGAFAVKKGTAE